jgi:hypothetical protein
MKMWMRRTTTQKLGATLVLILGCLAQPLIAADAVIDWNDIASQAIQTAVFGGRPVPVCALDLAMIQTAVYDAVQAIDGRFKPYHVKIPGASGSIAAAAAKAAHDVLVNRLPDQAPSLDTAYVNYLASHGLAPSDPGVGVGQQAAAGIIALRVNDGTFPPNPQPFVGGTDPGEWRPTPGISEMLVPWLGNVTPFTLKSSGQFGAAPPPPLTSSEYARAYKEVKELGSLTNSLRTPEQTDLANFYDENFLLLWNLALRTIAGTYVNNIGDTARLLALANLATADAFITCWNDKKRYFFWRPITAIQEGNNDGNPRTIGDPTWEPLGFTPPYPDYTSGANNITGAMTGALALFFGTDHKTFSLTSTNPLAVENPRTYRRFSDAAQDVVDVRIYQGIHFRFADTAGRRQGRHVAKWAFQHFLRPVNDSSDAKDDDEDQDEED